MIMCVLWDIVSQELDRKIAESRLRENDFNVAMNYIPKTECYKG